jgi:hypothetical protein
MRVRVSLDFDILIESFISLCIIETVIKYVRIPEPYINNRSRKESVYLTITYLSRKLKTVMKNKYTWKYTFQNNKKTYIYSKSCLLSFQKGWPCEMSYHNDTVLLYYN